MVLSLKIEGLGRVSGGGGKLMEEDFLFFFFFLSVCKCTGLEGGYLLLVVLLVSFPFFFSLPVSSACLPFGVIGNR
jgi:hypothetical protein